MDLKLDKNQKKRLTIELVILIVLIVVALLVYPSTRNYIFDFFKKPSAETTGLTSEQQELLDKTLPGTIESIEVGKIVLIIDANSNKKEVTLTDETIYRKSPEGGGTLEASKLEDFAKNDAVIVTLTGKKTAKALTATTVDLITPPAN